MTAEDKNIQSFTGLISGMDCPSCKSKIEQVLSKTAGVHSSEVNFLSQRLTVIFDPSGTSANRIESVLSGLGYKLKGSSVTLKWWQESKFKFLLIGICVVIVSLALRQMAPELNSIIWVKVILVLVAGFPVFRSAVKGALGGAFFSIEALMSVAAIGALFIDAADEALMVVCLFLVGEWLESVATARARANISALLTLAPPLAWRVTDQGTSEVQADNLVVGDVVEVRPGGRVPTDGVVVSGTSNVDESLVTGESMPVTKNTGSNVVAGTLNTEGVFQFSVSKITSENTLARISQMVEAAEGRRSPIARFIDDFSKWYAPLIVFISVLIAVVPPLTFTDASWRDWVYRGLGLLLIGCPCALVLSVPAAVTSAIAWGARHGILVKGGATLEAIGKVTRIAFDKTGTLTQGHPNLIDIELLSHTFTTQQALSLAGAVEQSSSHPLAVAICKAALVVNDLPVAQSSRAIIGKAMEATISDKIYVVASPKYIFECGVDKSDELEKNILDKELLGNTVVVLAEKLESGRVTPHAMLMLQDTLRPDAAEAVKALSDMGIATVLLTGDNLAAANVLGRKIGIEVKAGLMPEDKLALLESYKLSGPVAMVGDGVNDAPALAAATVGIAMGGGSDTAVETADAVLHSQKVQHVVRLVKLSQNTHSIIRQNVRFSLGFKAIFLVTTVFGVTGLWIAVLADTGATVLVTLNSMRLLLRKD